MQATDDNTCANCGKGEEENRNLKTCTACKMVKYCGRDCQIAHRPQHKRECKKRATEIHDEALLKEHPPKEDCPICFLPLPVDLTQTTFATCCGKYICRGCLYGVVKEGCMRGKSTEDIGLCAFCRTPATESDEDDVKRLKKLTEMGNAEAYHQLGGMYANGEGGLSQDYAKANKLWLQAGKLGCAEAYYSLSTYYYGIVRNQKKAEYFCELAAMGGDVFARHNLGCIEYNAGNYERAYKHYMLAAKAGNKDSLDEVKDGFMRGFVAKDEYASTLRAHQKRAAEMNSDMREKAAAS